MAERSDQAETDVETLTDDERKDLSKALKKVEAEVFQRVLKRLSAWMVVVLSIFLVGGLINLSSCYSNVESSAAAKLASDPEVRDKIVTKAQENLKELQEKLKGLNERAAEIEKENARASTAFVDDLEQIRLMVERIGLELSDRLPSTNQNKKSRVGYRNNERK